MHRKKVDIVRAWKDEAYRASLTDEERAALPEHPVGMIELDDAELGHVGGGQLVPKTPDTSTWSAYCSIKWCK